MTASIAPASASIPAPASSAARKPDEDFTFDDLLSIVNPLQHIPVVSTLYRAATGDTIKPFERIVGDTLFGGFWGGVSGVANVVYEKVTGKDIGQTVLALLDGDDDSQKVAGASTATEVADASSTASSAVVANSSAAEPAADGPPRSLQPLQNDAGMLALLASVNGDVNGAGKALAQRALAAYGTSIAAGPAN